MVSEIKFTIVEDGKDMSTVLRGTEDYDLEALADILTGMYALESDGGYYATAKKMIKGGCNKLINSI